MRHIRKGPEPPAFAQWKASGTADWQPGYGDLRGDCKDAVCRALLIEQGFVCCYCEQRISRESSHIEHLVAQGDEALALEFDNLLCSCNALRSQHCGHRKGNRPVQVHPLLPDCADRFWFGSAGTVAAREEARDPAATRSTIAILGLNCSALVARRREAIGEVLQAIAAGGGAVADVARLLAGLSVQDSEGRWLPFGMAIEQVLRRAERQGAE